MIDKEIAQKRRARQMAIAILARAREAGIPDKYLRLKREVIANVLDPKFHGGPKEGVPKFADSIYDDPNFLLKKNFITIDGGDGISRQLASFAILFRIIAYDKRGQYINCDSLFHKFQSINATAEITRNDLAEEMKSYDVLFVSEFDKYRFKPQFEHGSFFDEILADRMNYGRPTIISFVNPIISKQLESDEDYVQLSAEGKMDAGCGRYLAWLGIKANTTDSVLRVRVRSI